MAFLVLAFKSKLSILSNLAELLDSSWVTQRRTQLSIYEACIDDISKQITVKQMLKGFEDVSLIRGTGPLFSNFINV